MISLSVKPLDVRPLSLARLCSPPLLLWANLASRLPLVTPRTLRLGSDSSVTGIKGTATLGFLTVVIPHHGNDQGRLRNPFRPQRPVLLTVSLLFQKRTTTGLNYSLRSLGFDLCRRHPDSWRLRYFGTVNNLLVPRHRRCRCVTEAVTIRNTLPNRIHRRQIHLACFDDQGFRHSLAQHAGKN